MSYFTKRTKPALYRLEQRLDNAMTYLCHAEHLLDSAEAHPCSAEHLLDDAKAHLNSAKHMLGDTAGATKQSINPNKSLK